MNHQKRMMMKIFQDPKNQIKKEAKLQKRNQDNPAKPKKRNLKKNQEKNHKNNKLK